MKLPRLALHAPDHRSARLWLVVERATLVTGVLCLVIWSALHVDRATSRRRELDRFAALKHAPALRLAGPDTSLWSPERLAAWQTAVQTSGPAPLAILRIPKIHLEVPVLEGTDELTLNRGAGHIADTAPPGADGNSGIAAHRDGFFRGLKDIAVGDAIEVETPAGAAETYRIERTWIVGPEDVSVLDPTPTRSLTLVTCYPFYFIGSAPQRFIVRAVLTREASTR